MKRLLLAFALLCLCVPAWSATYEETFTPKANKAYNEDINVWVYTSEFAERFGMPDKWVDDELVGAYAVAFRVEVLPSRTMFPHKGPDVSMVRRHCILDVYLDDSADIPWIDDQVVDRKFYQPSSPSYLAPQTPSDQKWRWQPVGLPNWGGVVQFGTGDEHLGGFPVREYDKELYPGVVYISFAKSCTTPPKTGSWVEFHDYEPHNSPKPVWDTRTLGATHRIDIPASFMERLYENWYERSRRPARGEWGRVIKGQGTGEN